MKILVIENEDHLRDSLTRGLVEEGYAVDAIAHGEDGLHLAIEGNYSAVVLDIMLPGISGWELLSRLRKEKDTPVLVLTALDALQDRIRSLDGGADDFVAKPFHHEELYSRLRALLRRTAGRASSFLEIGDIKIDFNRKQIYLAGEEIKTTRMEFNIVEVLANQLGTPASREMLYEHLYDEADDSLGNSLYVHINKLRSKLGREFIRTVPGRGYTIDPV